MEGSSEDRRRRTVATVVMGALILVVLAVMGSLVITSLDLSTGISYEERLRQAQVALDKGEYETAILIYEQAIEERAADPEAYLGLARVYRMTARTEEALEILREGFAYTGSDRIMWMLAEIEQMMKDAEAADSRTRARTTSEADEDPDEEPQQNVLLPSRRTLPMLRSAGPRAELWGTVVDATTGEGLASATLDIRFGSSLASTPLTSIDTGWDGSYSVLLEHGEYWVTVTKSDYVKEDFKVTITGSSVEQQEDFVVSSELAMDEIRIVLTWGPSPSDLDAHLTGSLDVGTDIGVDFRNKQAYDVGGDLVADLDLDDTNGEGPETLTLHDPAGSFEYYVQDYTFSGTMSDSHAQVKIYVGDDAPVVANVPEGIHNEWSVCRIEHGRVSVTNTARD
jgi:hypothetical protein